MIYIVGFLLIILIGIVLPKYIEEEELKYQDEDDEYWRQNKKVCCIINDSMHTWSYCDYTF